MLNQSTETEIDLNISIGIGQNKWPGTLSTWYHVLIYIFYNLTFLIAILGNTFIIFTVVSNRRLQTVTNTFIANLAMGDLMTALFILPFSHITILWQYWPFGSFLCYFLAPTHVIIEFFYGYTLLSLVGDRFLFILHPSKPRLTKSNAIIIICFSWFIGILISLPIMTTTKYGLDDQTNLTICYEQWDFDQDYMNGYQERKRLFYNISLLGLQFFMPVGFILYFYYRIMKIFYNETNLASDNRERLLLKSRKKSVRLTSYVTFGYIMSHLPFNFLILYYAFFGLGHRLYTSFNIYWLLAHMLTMSQTMFNPIFCILINGDFRLAACDFYYRTICRGHIISSQERSQNHHNHHRRTTSTSTTSSGSKIWRFLPFVPPTNTRELRHHLLVQDDNNISPRNSNVELTTFNFPEGIGGPPPCSVKRYDATSPGTGPPEDDLNLKNNSRV